MSNLIDPDLRTLDGLYYAEPVIMQRERQAIFERSWQMIGTVNRLAKVGDFIATRLAGVDVIILRDENGDLRGFRNACRHRGAQLLKNGDGNCATIACPYHGWIYALSGELVDTPWFDSPSPFDKADLGLKDIRVETWRGMIFAALSPARELIDQLGDLPDEIAGVPVERFAHTESRIFSAPVNWKAYLDQFTENYHVPTVHAPDKSVGIERYTVTDRDNIVVLAAPKVEKFFGSRWIWCWPNWTVSLFPGGMKTSRLEPTSPTSFDIYFDFYFDAEVSADAELQARVIGTTKAIFDDDVGACELVQSNYANGNTEPGPFHPHLENGVAYFQTRVRDALSNT